MSGRFTPRVRLAAASALGAALVMSAGSAQAAATSTWFYANGRSGLVRVALQGGKLTGEQTLVRGSYSDSASKYFVPVSSQNGELAGSQEVWTQTQTGTGYTYTGTSQVFTWDAAHRKFHLLGSPQSETGLNALTYTITLFNSGKSVAFVNHSGTRPAVIEMPSNGGKPKTAYTAPAGVTALTGVAVSNDGKALYLAERSGGSTASTRVSALYKIVAGKKPILLRQAPAGAEIDTLALSPNGLTLAYAFDGFPPLKNALQLQAVGKGGITKAIAYQGRPMTLSWSKDGQTLYLGDQDANGWYQASVKTGTSSQIDGGKNGYFMDSDPVRAS